MREVNAQQITETVAQLCIDMCYHVSDDFLQALERAVDREESGTGREIMGQILENAKIAKEEGIPACQDTGYTVVFADVGQDCHIVGGDLSEAINAGVRKGYTEGLLRKSIVGHPLERVNTKDNTPAFIHTRIVPGDQFKVTVAAKGGGSENMSRLVNDLLNLAHVGRQELKREPTPLNSLVEEVVADLKGETEGRDIEWRIAPLPTIQGDPGLLKQVFANLLSNAAKYTRPRQHAVIEIGLRKMNDETVLFIRDNGVGFNMKYADKLFGVFQRLHRAEEFEGTGVGLAIVERVVKRHGGHIWAESEIDQGATFYFTLAGLDRPNPQPRGTNRSSIRR